MRQNDLMDILVLHKRLYGKLNEVMDLTGQLAEAADRKDQVSVQLLVSMRQEPIDLLQQTNRSLAEKRNTLSDVDRTRLDELMHGVSPADQNEQMLTEQLAVNRRLLERVIGLDQRVNSRLGGEDSFYAEASGSPKSK